MSDNIFERLDQMESGNVVEKIVSSIVSEIMSRRGFRQTWDDVDDGIRHEIVDALQGIVGTHIDDAFPA